jgi:predicted amino acid racemase
VLELCREHGIEPAAVIKGVNALHGVTEAIVKAGYTSIASSRIPHLRKVREVWPSIETVALRIPMISEAESVVRYADVSLNSEMKTIRLLDQAAGALNKRHSVILMFDLGDIREGVMDETRLVEIARAVETECLNIVLRGVGTNLGCYGSVVPTTENLSRLVSLASKIERGIGRKLDIVSGGATTSLPLMIEGGMPEGVNHLRIGAAILTRYELPDIADDILPELSSDAFILSAEIIEIGEKPTHPIGVLGRDCFGNFRAYEDRGVRKRALLALGAFDIGSHDKLIPLDPGVKTLGCSSDHLIVDIHDSGETYRLGDKIAFKMLYQSILFSTGNELVEKKIKNRVTR